MPSNRYGIVLRAAAVTLLVLPIAALALFSFSPSSAMDVFHRWPPSLHWWQQLVEDNTWFLSLSTSFLVGILSSSIAIVVVLPLALRWRLAPDLVAGKLLAAACLSVCLPPIVLAVGLYQAMIRVGLFDTIPGIVLALLSLTIPLTVFILTSGFRATDASVYNTARALGAAPVRAALTWVNATQKKTIAACLGTGVLLSMSEVTITVYLTDTNVLTISKRVMSGITRDIDPTGFAAMTLWMAMMVAVIVLTHSRWRGKRHG